MDRWRSKVAIVTGAGAGIGAAIAEKLVEEGLQMGSSLEWIETHDINLKRSERLEELSKKLQGKKGKLHTIQADISKEEEILQAFKWISENLGPANILINNAGIIQQTNLVEGDTKKWKQILDINVLGLCVATREAIKLMRANNIDGHIIHINSLTGHEIPNVPDLNVYPASKHAVTALTETLRQELNQIGSKIKISSVSPGRVQTEILQTNNFVMDEKIAELMKNVPSLKPEDLADGVLYILSTPPHVQVHEMIIRPVGETF